MKVRFYRWYNAVLTVLLSMLGERWYEESFEITQDIKMQKK